MSKKKKEIGITKIRKVFKDVLFDPREHLVLKIVSDMGDPIYCEQRVVELLKEIQQFPERHAENLKLSINLLAFAIALRDK